MIGDVIEIERAKRTVYEDLPVVEAPSIVSALPNAAPRSAEASTLPVGWMARLRRRLAGTWQPKEAR